MPRVNISDLGGSLNQGRAATDLAPNEWTTLENFYQFGSKLRRRGGMRRLTTAAFAERLTGLVSYRPGASAVGSIHMIVAGPTSWGRYFGGVIDAIPLQSGFTIYTSPKRWSMFQYKDICYGLREGVGLVRSDGTYVGPAGIAAPTAAPAIADGAAGDIPAASFKAVYTFYNHNTGMESNPSPVSNTLAHAGALKINWTGIGVSTNVQVTRRRIYRSLPDQSGEYFMVAEVPNNVDTTYTDNVLAQDLDDAVSQVNGTPPADMKIGTVWKERLFASDGKDVFHSEDGLIEAFDPQAIIPVFPDDGHDIAALHAYGDRLIIGKTNKIHYLVGSDPNTFALLTLSDRHGCISQHSMQSAEGYLFWLGLDNVYRSDGTNVVGIASVKLRTIIENLDDARAANAIGTVFPELGWYVLFIPGAASAANVNLVYNYRTDVWSTLPAAMNIEAVGDFFDTNLAQQMYVADYFGNLYRFQDPTYGYDDTITALLGAQPITAIAEGRAWSAEAASLHIIERVALLCAQYAESITLEILSEGITIKSRTVSLYYEPRWKLYNMSTAHQAKATSQLRVTYTGPTAIEIEGLALDIAPVGRPSMVAV